MSASLNKVQLIGNVVADPEVRRLNNGNPVVSLRLATNESWRDKASGERKEKAEFHNVVVFDDGLAGVIEKFVHKGSKVYVEGQLQTRKWTDKTGADRYSTEVVLQRFRGALILLDGKGAGEAAAPRERSSGIPHGSPNHALNNLDDDIPFAPEWR